jgi:23S rRNA (cytosine1962-C5)-methyltransferase
LRPAHRDLWTAADARYVRDQGDRGAWTNNRSLPEPWLFQPGNLTLQLKLSESGQVGVFFEQAPNWHWISAQVRLGMKVLNLFAYTGAATLAAAAAGAEVVHVDAARPSVAWARQNAELSGLADRPIRWIVEDARKFVAREVKRGQQYDGLILDPPTYGHGPRGQAWQIAQHLPALLHDCGKLVASRGQFLLLTCHAPGLGPSGLCDLARESISIPASSQADSGTLDLRTRDHRSLPSGVFTRSS